jgi:uncharacterized protein YbjT (DUF2867 family)
VCPGLAWFLLGWGEGDDRRPGRQRQHGDNPINFVSVKDVACLVGRAITDPATRGQVLEIGGPGNLSFNELTQAVQTAAGRTSAPRHVPPAVLRLMGATIGRAKPALGRQAEAALVMAMISKSGTPQPPTVTPSPTRQSSSRAH